jgi:small subunit ribosomal protein S20
MAKEEEGKNKPKIKRPTPLKRDDQNKRRNLRNRSMKSRVGTVIRTYKESLAKGDAEGTKTLLNSAYSLLDKAAQKGILNKNTASRTKARLAAKQA